ncbi:autotransporter-associated beta strand repeat-containing protein [Actinoplanes sp. CA-054009]
MHSPVDVIGGRILATALAAAILGDPANAALKTAAVAQAAAYFGSVSGPLPGDAYADRAANRRIVEPRLTYGLPRGRATTPLVVPPGAEVLLETRLPYLSADQRREVLRTTGLGGGHPLLDGPEHWGRLDLWAAADGYGAFARDVAVSLDGPGTWRNDIDGPGGLTKSGSGALTLTGANCYRGGTTLTAGTLAAGSPRAFGAGPLLTTGGTLAVRAGQTLDVPGGLTIGHGTTLEITAGSARTTVIAARRVSGRFARVVVPPGHRADVTYTRTTVAVTIRPA